MRDPETGSVFFAARATRPESTYVAWLTLFAESCDWTCSP